MPRKARPIDMTKLWQCPRCKRYGDIATEFGTRIVSGQVRPQSHCYFCRNPKNVLITDDRAQVTDIFKRYFPGDKEGQLGRRAYGFMVKRLVGKLPRERVRLTSEATDRLYG